VDTVNKVVPELIRHGTRQQPGLGIIALPEHVAQRLGVRQGVVVHEVIRGSAADKAGLRGTGYDAEGNLVLGDVIVAVNGESVANLEELRALLGRYKVGDTVTLTIIRDGEPLEIEVTLQAI